MGAGNLVRERLSYALDTIKNERDLLEEAKRVNEYFALLKVGHMLISRVPYAAHLLLESGYSVFLDYKFHDKPSVVADCVNKYSRLGVSLLTVHVAGGYHMLRQAAAAQAGLRAQNKNAARVAAVTVLTSQREEGGVSIADSVSNLTGVAQRAGLDAIVCAGEDLVLFAGQKLYKIVPGIVGSDGVPGASQERTITAFEAIRKGASLLVIGSAANRFQDWRSRERAIKQISAEVAEGLLPVEN